MVESLSRSIVWFELPSSLLVFD